MLIYSFGSELPDFSSRNQRRSEAISVIRLEKALSDILHHEEHEGHEEYIFSPFMVFMSFMVNK